MSVTLALSFVCQVELGDVVAVQPGGGKGDWYIEVLQLFEDVQVDLCTPYKHVSSSRTFRTGGNFVIRVRARKAPMFVWWGLSLLGATSKCLIGICVCTLYMLYVCYLASSFASCPAPDCASHPGARQGILNCSTSAVCGAVLGQPSPPWITQPVCVGCRASVGSRATGSIARRTPSSR